MVASRSLARATHFAKALGVERPVEGYEAAARMAFGVVDAVYIATPASEHARHALLCIEAGIPVLLEKPFAASVTDAAMIEDAARQNKVFCMEAMWTRFLPAARLFRDRVRAGAVGSPRLVSGEFGTSYAPHPEHGAFDPVRGGGALNQLGVYPLAMAQWLFGDPDAVEGFGVVGDTGVDEDVAISVRYGAVLGAFQASLRAGAPNGFRVMGDHGMLSFHGPIFRPSGVDFRPDAPRARMTSKFGMKDRLREGHLLQRAAQISGLSSRSRSRRAAALYSGNGYHYQADEVSRLVVEGRLESEIMPLAQSVALIETVDTIRARINSHLGVAHP